MDTCLDEVPVFKRRFLKWIFQCPFIMHLASTLVSSAGSSVSGFIVSLQPGENIHISRE